MKKFFSLFVGAFLITCLGVFAQPGNEFWFAAPDVSSTHTNVGEPGSGRPINLHVTAKQATTVTLTRPADPSFVKTVSIEAGEHYVWNLDGDDMLLISSIEVYPMFPTSGSFAQDKGFLLSAYPGQITAYYEWDNNVNREIISLKGTNSLGKDFWVSTQRAFPNGSSFGDAYSGFVAVATEDNTSVTIYPNGNNLLYIGTTNTTVTLNKGQAFAVHSSSISASNHLVGVHVTSDKDISIIQYDDSIEKSYDENAGSGNSYNIVADQTIPVENIGSEYVVVKGDVYNSSVDGGERVCITTTVDNTEIFVDGVSMGTISNAGGYYEYELVNYGTYITASNPVYAFHLTGTSGGGELGGALLPPIDGCNGSNSVAVRRSSHVADSFLVNLIVRSDTNLGSPYIRQGHKYFDYSIIRDNAVIASGAIPYSYFSSIHGYEYAFLKEEGRTFFQTASNRVMPNDVLILKNDIARFQLGIVNGGEANGGKYAYFSDYAAHGLYAGVGSAGDTTKNYHSCGLNPILLMAEGGQSYTWKGIKEGIYDTELSTKLSSTTASSVYFTPDSAGNYTFRVKSSGECFTSDSVDLHIKVDNFTDADFDLDISERCAPLIPQFTNLSDSVNTTRMTWMFEYPDDTLYVDTLPLNFSWPFPTNETTENIHYKVTLVTETEGTTCTGSKSDTLTVYPGELLADFTMVDTIYCDSKKVSFDNLTESDGAVNYKWTFGDSQEYTNEVNPQKNYDFSIDLDTIYTVKLVAKMGVCVDSLTKEVEVKETLRADFDLTETDYCDSTVVLLENKTAANGEPKYTWIFGDGFKSTETSPRKVYPYYAGLDEVYTIRLIAKNLGCSDTLEKDVTVKEIVRANFSIFPTGGVSPLPINITNKSVGAEEYFWDFGNQESSSDESPELRYTTTVNKDYNLSLIAINGACRDTMTTTVSVTPNTTSLSDIFTHQCKLFYNDVLKEITINYEITEHSDFLISIYDLQGKELKNIRRDNLAAGTYSETILVTKISNEVLIVKVSMNNETSTRRILVK